MTDIGPVEVDIPRDRDGTFEPRIVRQRQRRLSGIDELVIWLSARGHSWRIKVDNLVSTWFSSFNLRSASEMGYPNF